MKLIGLTGGIGSGKSTVAQLLHQHGWEVVDADQIAREIVNPGQPVLRELKDAFGQDICSADGTLHRGLLAQRAFETAERTAVLNGIMHPPIQALTQQRFQDARQRGVQYCVYDMPLLVDNGLHTGMDEVIVVEVDPAERVRRLVAHRGLSAADARARMARQITDAHRRAAATYVIDNNGSLQELSGQVNAVIAAIEQPASG